MREREQEKKKEKARQIIFVLATVVLAVVIVMLAVSWGIALRAQKTKTELQQIYESSQQKVIEESGPVNTPNAEELRATEVMADRLATEYAHQMLVTEGVEQLRATEYAQKAQATEAVLRSKAEGYSQDGENHPINEDFLALYKINQHIVGWLKAGDKIDLPVVKYDNSYYLTHNYYDAFDSNGTLFVNEANQFFPRDDVILIHGHNMEGGSMFGSLLRYMSYEYLEKHPVISFRTVWDDEDVYYTPVAVLTASIYEEEEFFFNFGRVRFEDDFDPDHPSKERKSTAFQNYLHELKNVSIWEPKVDVNINDKLLGLVTCSYYDYEGRMMLVARQLREDETPQMIVDLYSASEK